MSRRDSAPSFPPEKSEQLRLLPQTASFLSTNTSSASLVPEIHHAGSYLQRSLKDRIEAIKSRNLRVRKPLPTRFQSLQVQARLDNIEGIHYVFAINPFRFHAASEVKQLLRTSPVVALTTRPTNPGDKALTRPSSVKAILSAIPSVAYDYSPLWNFNLSAWANFSIENGICTRLTGEFEVLGMAAAGYVTNPDVTPLSGAGAVNNCPVVHRFLSLGIRPRPFSRDT